MQHFFDYKISFYSLSEVIECFGSPLRKNKDCYTFQKKVDDLYFIMKGMVDGDDFDVFTKQFVNEENKSHAFLDNESKVYSEIHYNDIGKPVCKMISFNGELDSTHAFEPSYESLVDGATPQWHINGENVTPLFRKFCNENNIDINNLQKEEKVLLIMNYEGAIKNRP